MNSRFNPIAVAVMAAMLSAPVVANASLFTFDPTGTPGAVGDIANVALIDQSPGNALALGGLTAIRNALINGGGPGALPVNFTLFYQANLNSMQFANTTNAFSNGTGGNFFTFVGGFGETVVAVSPFPGTATFAFDPANPVNYFQIWRQAAIGDNFAGTGFQGGGGTLILSAHLIAEPVSNFQVTSTAATALDQSPNGNDWGTQTTVTGGGQTNLVLLIDSVNANYFPTLTPGTTQIISNFNTSNGVPFNQIDPSTCFNTAVLTCPAGINTTVSLGTQNGNPAGTGTDVLFQADGNQSITVPEPGSLALIGLGLGILGLGAKRRRQSKAA